MVDATNDLKSPERPIYLDCAATTPIEPEVLDLMMYYFKEEFGNSGSRTHLYGTRAKQAVENARAQVAQLVDCDPSEAIFTSGATESNNLAILGLTSYGLQTERRHIVSTQIEHKSVLEPLQEMQRRGFEVALVAPNSDGWVEPSRIENALRKDTLLVSVMHANNETGVIQPIDAISGMLKSHPAFLHVDAAQTYGKLGGALRDRRIDLISVSAHKIYGPKGVGALITRRRGFSLPPLNPIMHGGGQERALRPGTIPVPLVVALGEASRLATQKFGARTKRWQDIGRQVSDLIKQHADPVGDQRRALLTTASFEFRNLDAQTIFVALKDSFAFSDGAACSSSRFIRSHVLRAMGLTDDRIDKCVRLSWSHRTEPDDLRVLEVYLHGLARANELNLGLAK